MPAPASLTEQFDTLYSTTWQNMRDVVVDQIFTATPFWYWLYSRDRIRREEGGRWLGIQLMYGTNTTVKTIGRGGSISMNKPEIITTALFNWKTLAGSVIRLYEDERKNRGRNQIINWVKADIRNLELSIVDYLESMLYSDGTGNGGLDFDGLGNLVSMTPSAAVTVGGIDPSVNTWWQNKQRTYSGGAGLIPEMRSAYNTVSIGNDHPSFIMTGQTYYENYEASLVNILRVIDTPPKLGDMGFEVLRFKGGGITFSNHAGFVTNNMYFLNERYLELVIDSMSDFEMTQWKAIPNQLDRVAQVVLRANAVCSNRRMQMVMTGLS